MGEGGVWCFFPMRAGFDGLCRWVEWEKEALGVFFLIRVGFDGQCRWVEWEKEALGVFFPIRVGFDGQCGRGGRDEGGEEGRGYRSGSDGRQLLFHVSFSKHSNSTFFV